MQVSRPAPPRTVDAGTERRQFRILHREFLFRVIDRELLSAHAQGGDSSKLLLQFVSLLIFIGILFCIPAWSFGEVQPPQVRLLYAWSLEHFFIATTMLVVGLFSVLIWDSLFPDRRDVLVLSPLPIRTRTIFFARLAAIASALGLAVGSLHLVAGVIWPVRLAMTPAPAFAMPAFTSDPAIPPVRPDELKATLDRDLDAARHGNGWLTPGGAGGLVIGISTHGKRQIYAYGAATPDSMFEIGSITKTFTATLLAHMADRGTVRLDEPVRDLLPAGSIGPPARDGVEITLRDLATHHSGLPVMDPFYRSGNPVNPYAGYTTSRLYWYLTYHGLQRPAQPHFVYSNIGFALLGHALTRRASTSYATLLHDVITGPLHMEDTTISLSADQQRRFIGGYNPMREARPRVDVAALAGAGAGVVSTAGDMLTWLEANLAAERTRSGSEPTYSMPERTHSSPIVTDLAPNRAADPAHDLAADLAAAHRPQADAGPSAQIALAWFFGPTDGIYAHDGATLGHTADSWFDPANDTAGIVLSNVSGVAILSAGPVGSHLRARLTGKPAVAIEEITIPASPRASEGPIAGQLDGPRSGHLDGPIARPLTGPLARLLGELLGVARLFAAYWFTMLAAGAFVFCAVMCVQGLAAQTLPRRHFLRVSSMLQLGAFALIVSVYCLQAFAIVSQPLIKAQQGGLFSSLPSFWFLALFQALAGSEALAPLVPSAWLGLTIVAAGAATMYALSYYRTVRRIVEEADIMPAPPGARRLPTFGSPLSTAIVHFSVRTLLRSPQHRVILAFYWGIGFALTFFFLKTPHREQVAADGVVQTSGIWQDPSTLMLVSLLMMGLGVLGARVAFSLPRDLRSNWIFRVTPVQSGAPILAARRRALTVLSVLPVWTASAALFLTIWPWREAAGHLIVLALVGMVLVELSLRHSAQKIPFTCSYLPGRSTIHVTLWVGLMLILPLTIKGAAFELQALQDPATYAKMLAVLALAWAAARFRAEWLARSEDLPPQFEEDSPDAIVALNVWDTASLTRSSRSIQPH